MARVVESIAGEFKSHLVVKKVITRTLSGAERYREIVRQSGAQVPVPSILINGELVFMTTPGVEELRACVREMIAEN